MSTRTAALFLAALLPLGLAACQGNDATRPNDRRGRDSGRTSDAGSRFVEATGPLGGLTRETPPLGPRRPPRPPEHP